MPRTKTRKAKAAKAGIKTKKSPKYLCFRCQKTFPTRRGLKIHSRAHLQALRELIMLEKGHIPIETKMGSEFKGKNKIIVAEN